MVRAASLCRLSLAFALVAVCLSSIAAAEDGRRGVMPVDVGTPVSGNSEVSRSEVPIRHLLGASSALASPGIELEIGYYDIQRTGSVGRTIDKWNDRIMATWMQSSDPSVTSSRIARFHLMAVGGSSVPTLLDNGGTAGFLPLTLDPAIESVVGGASRPGMPQVTHLVTGESMISYHEASTGNLYPLVDYVAYLGDPPILYIDRTYVPPEPFGIPATDVGFNTGVATDVIGLDTVVHLIAQRDNGSEYELYYWHGYFTGDFSFSDMAWEEPVLLATLGFPNAVIVSSLVNDHVAVVYTVPRGPLQGDMFDVVYRVSTDGGTNWNTAQNISDPSSNSTDVGTIVLSAAYDLDGTLHVVYNTIDSNPVQGVVSLPCQMWHWNSDRGTSRRIAYADWVNECSVSPYRAGQLAFQMTNPSVVICPAPIGAPGTEYIYAIWSQVGPDFWGDCATVDSSATPGGYANSELWYSVSSDDGMTWDHPQNFTGTVTPDCQPGDCAAERWASAAAWADSGIYLTYVVDRHSGVIFWDEGEWSVNSVMALGLEARTPLVQPRIAIMPSSRPYPYPSWTAPFPESRNYVFDDLVADDTASQLQVVVGNLGNAGLVYSADVQVIGGGQGQVTVNGVVAYDGSIAAGGADDTLTIAYDGIGLADSSNWMWVIAIQSNDSTNNESQGGVAINLILNATVVVRSGAEFTVGDANGDEVVTSADIIFLVNHVFKGASGPDPTERGDVNCDGPITSADIIFLVNYVFKGGTTPDCP